MATNVTSRTTAAAKRHDGVVVGPTRRGGARQPVDERRHAEGDRQRAGEVEAAVAGGGGAEHPWCRDGDGQADGHVHEQHPPPRGDVGEDPSEQQPERPARARHRRVDAHGARTLGPFGVGVLDQGQGGGRRDGTPDTLGDPGRDQPQLVGGEASQERGGGEDDHADGEHPAPAEEVAAAAAEQKQPSEGEGVGGDDPLESRGGEVELVLDRGQGDVHDGAVEDHHHLDRADQHQGQPGVSVLGQRLFRTLVDPSVIDSHQRLILVAEMLKVTKR